MKTSTKDKIKGGIYFFAFIIGVIISILELLEKIANEYRFIFWCISIILFIYVIFFVIKDIITNYTIPSPKNNKTGVLVSFNSEYEEALTFFQKSFFSEFKKTAEEENDIEIITLPRKLIGKIVFSEDTHDKKSIKLASKLEEKNILYYLLAEYYYFVGDQKLANENFNIYISKCVNERDLLFAKERMLVCNNST